MAATALEIIESCEGCGKCCETQVTPPFMVFLDPSDWTMRPINPEYDQEDADWLNSAPFEARAIRIATIFEHTDGAPCCWYDAEKKQCRFYDHRPQICRDFERGSTECRTYRNSQ